MIYARRNMVERLRQKGVFSSKLLDVMGRVPRHLFVSEALRYRAYDEASLPIGHGQTISKPSVIALMVQCLGLCGTERVLELGTGSGYQTALLAEMTERVVSLERIGDLADRARGCLVRQGYRNAMVIHSGDFLQAEGRFDAVIVAAGAQSLPQGLLEKLEVGGKLIIPEASGRGHSIRKYVRRDESTVVAEEIGSATFVPLILGASA